MTKTATKAKKKGIERKRPERLLKDVLAEREEPKVFDKSFTAMRVRPQKGAQPAKSSKAAGGLNDGIYTPTAEQMAQINQFTMEELGPEDVVCFDTWSCNDMVDRDTDRFRTQCVDAFAKLEGDRSPTGKSFMVSHDYTKLPVARIFDTGTADLNGARFLTNSVYMLNSPQYADFIENVRAGIYWAVSVGVMLGVAECSVCASQFSSWFPWCFGGHEKGLFYDPDDDSVDEYGWPEPVEEGTKNAIMCVCELDEPIDFYELSQCFLGAQYGAQIAGKGAMKGYLKAASAPGVPILNLGKLAAKEIPFVHRNEKVVEAHRKGLAITKNDDGTETWEDNDLLWQYDPEEDEVMSLGSTKSDDDDNEEVNEDGTNEGSDDEDALGSDESGSGEVGGSELERSVEREGIDGEDDADEDEDGDGSGEPGSSGLSDDNDEGADEVADPDDDEDADLDDDEDDELDESDDEDDEDDDDDEKQASVSKKDVLRRLNSAKVPTGILEQVRTHKGTAVDALVGVVASLSEQVKTLEPQAKHGVEYVSSLKKEALRFYVMSKQSGDKKVKVDTKSFERRLAAYGDDLDLLREEIADQKEAAQAKFPEAVRRSTVDQGPEVPEDEEGEETPLDKISKEKVRKLH